MVKNVTIILLLSCLVLGGCATTSDQTKTKAGGIALGAILGGALGYALGGEEGAALGAVLGGGAGFLVGNEVAKRKAQYASREDFLDAEIVRVAEFNETTRVYNAKLSEDVRGLTLEAEQLRANYDGQKVQKKEMEKKRADVQKRIKNSEELRKNLNQELEVQTAILEEERKVEEQARQQAGYQDNTRLARLEEEVEELRANIAQLQEGTVQLAGIDERLSI